MYIQACTCMYVHRIIIFYCGTQLMYEVDPHMYVQCILLIPERQTCLQHTYTHSNFKGTILHIVCVFARSTPLKKCYLNIL